MKSLADKVSELGGKLAPPASEDQIANLEAKLGYTIPTELRTYLSKHNGCSEETDEAIWNFWPCAKISSYGDYRDEDEFLPDNNWLRMIDPSAREIKLPASRVILFADSLIEAPTYGLYHSPGCRFDGIVFDTTYGSISALSLGYWLDDFIDHGEEGLLLYNNEETEQGGDGDAEEAV
ncbi:SMI1/KNR4 family protein [Akkermansiaceae bacterium]|nr:SMI1/KNR4 family protein [Akkermansiaceae bacterium]